MKHICLYLCIAFTLLSCGDDVEFNSPAFIASRDGNNWQADTFGASIDAEGFLTLTATLNAETLTLTVPTVQNGTYTLGIVDDVFATYTNANGIVFSTANSPDESVSIYPEIGEVRLDAITNNTFSGTFYFTAFDASGLNSVNFTGLTREVDTNGNPIYGGTFFQVPLVSGSIPAMIITCDDTQDDAIAAQQAFDAIANATNTIIDSAAYVTACSNYAEALELQRIYCGDEDNTLQTLIDNLANCTFPCDLAINNRSLAEAEFDMFTTENYIDVCTQYQTILQQQIDSCGDLTGDIQAILDDLNCADTDADGLADVFEDFNGNGDFEDDDTDSDGIANFMDDDDDGDNVPTATELMFTAQGMPLDTDNDGSANYFDIDDDNDGVHTIFEDLDGDGDPTNDDTDMDGIPNYLDNDDDNDGILTINENADPNGDGNPSDALDTNFNGTPDYLEN